MGSEINYDYIYARNIELANKVLKECSSEVVAWKKFYKEFYRDPDGYRIKEKMALHVQQTHCFLHGESTIMRGLMNNL